MKHSILIFVLLLLFCTACVHERARVPSWPRLPLIVATGEQSRIDAFKLSGSQPWLVGERKAPLGEGDLLVGGEVRLVSIETYLDGGSRGFLLEGEPGKFFAFCTSNPRSGEKPAFLLATLHFSELSALRVEEGSASFVFFYDLLWSFADDPRYRPDAELLRKTQESSGMSVEQFESFLKKPNQSLQPTGPSARG